MDGFIWRVRDAKVREDLGMGAPAPDAASPGTGEARHWAFIVLLFAGSIALAASEYAHGKGRNLPGMPANLVALVPNSGYAHFLRGSELAQSGELDAARSHYRAAIALDTNFGFIHGLVAELDLRLADTTAAIASYEQALRLEPGDATVNANLAGLYLSTGRLAQAETAFRSLIRLEPDAAGAHYGLAFALLQQRRGLDAKPHLERSLELDSLQPAALNYLGMVEQALGNPGQARRLYVAALRLDPHYEHARQNLATLDHAPLRGR
jgi:tetratricopeptide (TPR) repeat protein